ncbi:MAG: tetratricopeptide repeat protein, partial [Smithellaceae bacterium]|nr:tetratricopeptide repeat protein [Smithellaceae bacterium]
LGWIYFKQGNFSLAARLLKEAAIILPEDQTIAEHLGDAYARAGMVTEAMEIYRRILVRQPNNGSVAQKIEMLKKTRRGPDAAKARNLKK